jgi:hypothetical protein
MHKGLYAFSNIYRNHPYTLDSAKGLEEYFPEGLSTTSQTAAASQI